MRRDTMAGLLLLGLAAGCASEGAADRAPRVGGSEAILAQEHDVLAYITVGGVT